MIKICATYKLCLIAVFIAVILHSCEKVAQLSDDNIIISVSIDNVEPEKVLLDNPVVEESSVIIPVKFGKYLFPLKLYPTIICNDSKVKILGLEDDGSLIFPVLNSINTITIVSESGMPKRYEIKLNLISSNEISEILKFKIKSSSNGILNVGEEAFADPTESIVKIYAVDPTYPLIINPEVEVSEGAVFTDWEKGESLTFSFQGETKTLNLLSESGREEKWQVSIINAKEDITSNQRLINPFNHFDAKFTSSLHNLDTVTFNTKDRQVILYYSGDKKAENFGVLFNFSFNEFITGSSLYSGEEYIFQNEDDSHQLIIIDNITGNYNKWEIVFRQTNTIIEVTGVEWGSYYSSDNDIKLGPPEIYPELREISIPVLSNGEFPLIINDFSILLSQPTENSLSADINFSSMNDYKTFNLTRNGKNELWSLKLVNRLTPLSNQADVTGFHYGKPSFSYSVDEIYIEPEISEIVIVCENFEYNTSLKLTPIIETSTGSKIEGMVSGGVVEIPWGGTKKFKIISESGSSREWTIRVIPAPQLPNKDFEEWVVHPQFKSLETSIFPSDGSGWNSSNNPSAVNVVRVDGYQSKYAARILTKLSTINFADIIKVTSLTSGNLFLGKFRYSTATADVYSPGRMIVKGIPFNTYYLPKQLIIWHKYRKGETLVKTSPKITSTTIPAFNPVETVAGNDQGLLKADLWNNSQENLVASASYIFSGNSEWTRSIIDFSYDNWMEGSKYISVSISSSIFGEIFTGADGSVLDVDSIRLIYHLPGNGSIKIK